MSEENKSNNIERIVIQKDNEPKRKMWLDWIQSIVSVITMVITAIALFITVPETISNTNDNKQTQVVIEPRDGDIIVKDGDDYKLLQLVSLADISFPTKVQEIQYKYTDVNQHQRVDINNINNEDWSKRDSFEYVINNFSINPNKVINLLDNISEISIYCDFYSEKNISTFIELGEKSFNFKMRTNQEEKNFSVTKSNVRSNFSYVTKEINDGIEWVKIRVEIKYLISERLIIDTITSDWIATDADLI